MVIALVGAIFVLGISAGSIHNANNDSEGNGIKSTIITFEGISKTTTIIMQQEYIRQEMCLHHMHEK